MDGFSDEELIHLYRNAYGLILPSFYEGFGIPVLEAMSYDCPVITSNTSSLPEIGGDACLYFDPNNFNELVEKMEELKKPDVRTRLIKSGHERIKSFSWKKCAEETLQVLKSVGK